MMTMRSGDEFSRSRSMNKSPNPNTTLQSKPACATLKPLDLPSWHGPSKAASADISSAVGVPARRRCAPPPNDVAAPEMCAGVAGGAPTPVSNRRCAEPTAPTSQHRRHQPKYAPSGGSGPVAAAVWPRPGPGCWPDAPPPPAAGPGYPPQYVACDPSLSCQRRNPAAPFFGGLHGLAVNNRPAGCRFPAASLTDPDVEGAMNLLPGFLPPPDPEIVVDQLPRRKVMGQETPSAAGAQHIPDGVDNLPAGVFGWTSPRFGGRNQWFQHGPLRISQINCSAHGPSLTRIHRRTPMDGVRKAEGGVRELQGK